MIEDLITVQLTKKLGYCCDIQQFKIITNIMAVNILLRHNQIFRSSI